MNNYIKYILYTFLVLITIACSSSKQAVLVPERIVSRDSLKKADNIYIDALKQKSLSNVDQAQDLFLKSLSYNPKLDAAYFELARIYYSKKDVATAESNLIKAIYLDPKNEWYLLLYSDFLRENKDLKNCELIFQKLHELKPKRSDYLIEIINLQIDQKKYREAILTIEKTKLLIGNSREIALQKEELHRILGQNDLAIETIKEFIGLDTLKINNILMLALSYKQNGKQTESVKLYKKAHEMDQTNGLALLELSEHYRKIGDKQKHEYYQSKAFASDDISYDAKVRTLFSYVQLMNQDPAIKKETIKLARILTQAHPGEANAFAIYGEILYNSKQLELAKTAIYAALELKKDVYNYWNQLLIITAELEQYQELIKTADSAAIYFPNQPVIFYMKSIAHNQLNEYANTIPAAKRGINITFDNLVLKAEFHALLGEAHHNLKQYESSDVHFWECIKIDSNNAYVLNNYSYYLSVRNQHLRKAERLSKRSNRLSPNAPSFEDTYAWILFRLEKYEQALIWINKAVNHGGSNNSVIIEHKGDILFKVGAIDEAVEFWNMSKNLGNNSEILIKKIEDRQYYE